MYATANTVTARSSWPPSSRVWATPGTDAAITPSPNIPMSSRSTWVRLPATLP